MVRPNILTYRGDGKLQYITDAEYDELIEVVLEEFATVDGPGNIYAGGVAGANTVIGTFTDTRYQGVEGSTDLTILSTTTTFYQDLTTNYGTVSNRPITWNTTQQAIKEPVDTELSDAAQEIIDYLIANDGPGTYRIGTSAPVGGTWSIIATINNIEDENLTVPYYLYKKIAGSLSSPSARPLKLQNSSLKEMTDSEIAQLVAKVRELIVTTGIGTYELASTAPSTGTWTAMGTITDTRSDLSTVNYVGPSYTGTITQTYFGTSFGPEPTFLGSYTGTTSQSFFGGVIYFKDYFDDGVFGGSYIRFPGTGYEAPYVVTGNYTGTVSVTYVGTYNAPGALYYGSRTANIPADFAGTYGGDVVGSGSQTITNRTLWRRIA